MKSPRRIVLTGEMVSKYNLSTDPPPPNSLFWQMWNACSSIANQALQTPFIQGIGAGTLDPVVYGGFNVNDAAYCFNGAPDYLAASQRATDPALQGFLAAKYQSYEKYNQTFPQIWRVKDATSIVPYDVCVQYSQFESWTASNQDPIYCIVAMLPCEYLWAWLAQQLSPVALPGNLYLPWITGNDDPSGAYAMGNFLNSYAGTIDQALATNIYTTAMGFERDNFAAALPGAETPASLR